MGELGSSPYIIPNTRPLNPFPHSLLRTRQTLASDRRFKNYYGGDWVAKWTASAVAQKVVSGLKLRARAARVLKS